MSIDPDDLPEAPDDDELDELGWGDVVLGPDDQPLDYVGLEEILDGE
jgi:hypothetical protein